MERSKLWRVAVASAGLVALAGAACRIPLWLHMCSLGEISGIKLLCVVTSMASLLVGAMRFVRHTRARGTPFLLALLACLPGAIGIPWWVLSPWYGLVMLTSFVGAMVGFGIDASGAAAND